MLYDNLSIHDDYLFSGSTNYLGDEENPEELKLLVYHMFKECMDDFLPTKIMLYYLFIKNNKDSTHSIRKMKLKFGDEKLNKTTKLIQKMMLVNVVLSPLQVSTYSFVLIFVSVIKSIFSFPSKAFGSTARRTESAWYRAIH
ncbi:MAG: hypothetical protein KZQ70_00720 [gamma proteobacterium symbiont of Lucinoma myriamae]|nr:hypothetical protein [gamma proteobacterium symbiont of Lucinoma myriamae]MCU7819323.1 hypothetical protein [gamma proteobacterium symbiont of Lucinoma myriamae]MCU7831110.1 hypothetical protein [gamma proteobacterium symbiont of Lucinoma myriamae]